MESVVGDAIRKGGEVLKGGERAKSKGSFYKPTLLGKVSHDMLVLQEEVFGPIAPISIVENELEAIKLSNDSKFGLGASIWTQDLDKAEKIKVSRIWYC